MISMVSGGKTFSPNPADGIVLFFEPLRTLASAIVDFREGLGSAPLAATIYSFALLLLFAAFFSALSSASRKPAVIAWSSAASNRAR